MPSPIFPDGSIYSLPIPGCDEDVPVTYGDLYHEDEHAPISIGQVVEGLTRDRPTQWTSGDGAFISTDIRENFRGEIEGSKGMFAAEDAQQGHLRKQGVGRGDMFLFFGIFQRVEQVRGGWRFVRGAPRQHILFGMVAIGFDTSKDLGQRRGERLVCGHGPPGPGR